MRKTHGLNATSLGRLSGTWAASPFVFSSRRPQCDLSQVMPRWCANIITASRNTL
ncbi:hypothetical protein ART_0761 [Arthrobacter sp. PAMC 25486]|nr:hypothetical protein ART_0761 [Arthrobacter sp. PAMC 25486]